MVDAYVDDVSATKKAHSYQVDLLKIAPYRLLTGKWIVTTAWSIELVSWRR